MRLALILLLAPVVAAAAPAEVTGLVLDKDPSGYLLDWDDVTLDALGQPTTVDAYRIYASAAADSFPIGYGVKGSSASSDLLDEELAFDGLISFLVTAVDDGGVEGGARPSDVTTPPVLSGFWTPGTIEISWTPAEPQSEVERYLVFVGTRSRSYTEIIDVGAATATSLDALNFNTNYYIGVAALDLDGNLSALSNEHIDALAGTIDLRVHDEDRLCPFDSCPAGDPDKVQRRGGQEMMIPVDFPEGDWTNITMTYTVDSRLCAGTPEAPDKCGQGNPGGWNPCGDPWDRTASVYLVLNDCVESGGGCYGGDGNLELLRAITPFGTDAPPPDGTGVVGPTEWSLDITPLRPVLTGRKHVGAYIATWVAPGWLVSVDFHFSEDPAEASPKPPAAGVIPVWFRDGGNSSTPKTVSIPAEATSVSARIFTTGHGGVLNDDCICQAQGRPCDEFCSKQVLVRVDNIGRWVRQPTRTDCSPLGENVCGPGTCSDWNACGCPSCTFNRSGWCPGRIACHENEPCDQDADATSWFTPGSSHDVYMDVRLMTPGASWANSLALFWYE